MKYVFLVNSFSLKDEANDVIARIIEVANERKLDYKIEVNTIHKRTEDILKEYQKDEAIIICIGGDGTINRTLNGIVNTKNILGYIPFGTGNDFYRTNRELLQSGINDIDLVKINNKYFINVACFGIDADIASTKEEIDNPLIPRSQRYNAAIVKNFINYAPKHLNIKVNDEEYEDDYATLAVCNARYYGGGYKIGTNALLDDGLLDIYIVDDMSRLKIAKLLLGMKKGKHENDPKVKVIKAKKVFINAFKTITCNIDGDTISDRTFNIEVIPKGIKVYYDQELIDEITNVRKK